MHAPRVLKGVRGIHSLDRRRVSQISPDQSFWQLMTRNGSGGMYASITGSLESQKMHTVRISVDGTLIPFTTHCLLKLPLQVYTFWLDFVKSAKSGVLVPQLHQYQSGHRARPDDHQRALDR